MPSLELELKAWSSLPQTDLTFYPGSCVTHLPAIGLLQQPNHIGPSKPNQSKSTKQSKSNQIKKRKKNTNKTLFYNIQQKYWFSFFLFDFWFCNIFISKASCISYNYLCNNLQWGCSWGPSQGTLGFPVRQLGFPVRHSELTEQPKFWQVAKEKANVGLVPKACYRNSQAMIKAQATWRKAWGIAVSWPLPRELRGVRHIYGIGGHLSRFVAFETNMSCRHNRADWWDGTQNWWGRLDG